MEPVLKPGPSSHVDTAPSLPQSDVTLIREAIRSAGGATVVEITIPGGLRTPQTPQPTAQILITIIDRLGPGSLRGFNPNTESNPLLDALRALRESGLIGATLDKGDSYRPSAPTPTHGPAPRGTGHDRAPRSHYEHYRPPRDTDHRTEEPRKAESAQREAPRGEDRPARPETPQEQRLREVLEKAVVQYLERATETPPGTDRPAAQARVERPTAPSVGYHQSPPSIDPDRAPQTPPSIVTPAIRDVLNDTRNDTARLLQQLLGADPNASRPSPHPTPGTTTEASLSPTLNPALTEARAGITERLTQLRDALQVTIERTSPQPLSAPERISQTGQGPLQQGDFTRVEAPVHNARSQTSIQSESRAGSDLPRTSSPGLEVPSIGISVGPLRAAGQRREESTNPTHEKASDLLDALSKAAQKILSVESLRKIEYAAETAVLTAAAAIALGVMGSELILKELLALSEDLVKRLRGEKNLGESGEQEVVEVEQLVRELEEACADRGVETINQPTGLVADIPGILKDNSSGLPLEGFEIDGGALGITFTNAQGEFIFRNVPLDEGFAVVARQDGYSFFPNPAVGTVSATTYLTIFGTKLP